MNQNNIECRNIDFGFCAINQDNIKNFILENNTKYINNIVIIEVNDLFKISPKKATLPPLSKINFIITFKPVKPIVLLTKFKIKYLETNKEEIIKISAIGKLPYIDINNNKYEFRNILVSNKISKDIILKNISEVGTKFIINKEGLEFFDENFIIKPLEGYIPSNKSFVIEISFKPLIYNLDLKYKIKIIAIGGNSIDVSIKANSIPNDLKIYNIYYNFDYLQIGKTKDKNLIFQNSINNENNLNFQIYGQSKPFYIINNSGIIKKNNKFNIHIKFKPKLPIFYFQRIFVYIHNFKLIIIDLFGAGKKLLLKPISINYYIINSIPNLNNNYQASEKKIKKIFFKNKNLNKSFKIKKISINFKYKTNTIEKFNKNEESISYVTKVWTNFYEEIKNEDFTKLFFSKLHDKYVDAPEKINLNLIQEGVFYEFVVTNKFIFDLNLYLENDDELSFEHKNIIIKPQEHKIIRFNINIKEKFRFYFKNLFIYFSNKNTDIEFNLKNYKNNINSRKRHNYFVSYFKIDIIGHNFKKDVSKFIPIVEVKPKVVKFIQLLLKETDYKSFVIENNSNIKCIFEIKKFENTSFSVYPTTGIIKEKSKFYILCKFKPLKDSYMHNLKLKIRFNLLDSFEKTINLKGIINNFSYEIENNGEIFFPPAYINVYSKKKIKFKNNSKIKLELRIPDLFLYKNFLRITPNNIYISPQETSYISIHFKPNKKKLYKIKLKILIWNIDTFETLSVEYLNIYGEAINTSLLISPKVIDFSIVQVNKTKEKEFNIYNNSNSKIYIKIISNNPIFKYNFKEGEIEANSKKIVSILFKPSEDCWIDEKIEIKSIKNPLSKLIFKNEAGNIKNIECYKIDLQIIAQGKYPKMKIIDIRNKDLSVSSLWEKFHINDINEEIDKNLSKNEIKYNSNKIITLENLDIVNILKNFVWDFGIVIYDKLKFSLRKIYIVFKNNGGTLLEWNMSYLKLKETDDNKLFQIIPNKGKLEVNKTIKIKLIYKSYLNEEYFEKKGEENFEENHECIVKFHINNGKSFVLNLKGTTIASVVSKLTLKNDIYKLPDIPIGLIHPCYYPIKIFNYGNRRLNYQIIFLTKLNEKFKEFDLNINKGYLNPFQLQTLCFLFHPLVVKRYNFNVLIKVFNFEKLIQELNIKFIGKGIINNFNKYWIYKPIMNKIPDVIKNTSGIYFSKEELNFNDINYDEEIKILYLINNSNFSIKFEFFMGNINNNFYDKLIINPSNGIIGHKSQILLEVILIKSKTPSLYSNEINCKLNYKRNKYKNIFIRINKYYNFELNNNLFIQNYPKYQDLFNLNFNEKKIIEILYDNIIKDSLSELNLKSLMEKININNEVKLYKDFNWNKDINYSEKYKKFIYNKKLKNKILKNCISNVFHNIIKDNFLFS